MVASLLLHKVMSLLPSGKDNAIRELEDADESFDDVISEEELLARMSRFSPYRAITSLLIERKEKQSRRFKRICLQEDLDSADNKTPHYEIGDLYHLSKLWWDILSDSKKNGLASELIDIEECWDGVPGSLPDEERIQTRISEITEKLTKSSTLLLSNLLSVRSVSAVVVTLLALLEMCRMKKISVLQEELFGEIRINAAFSDSVTY
jgi:chromatin segregation and condensation protein Rec8/ScpA/Scc1 (kleisin family)